MVGVGVGVVRVMVRLANAFKRREEKDESLLHARLHGSLNPSFFGIPLYADHVKCILRHRDFWSRRKVTGNSRNLDNCPWFGVFVPVNLVLGVWVPGDLVVNEWVHLAHVYVGSVRETEEHIREVGGRS